METAIIGIKALTFAGTLGSVGTDVVIKTLTTTISGLVKGISGIMTTNHPYLTEIKKTLEKLDIINEMSIIRFIIQEQTGKNIPNSIKHALESTTETLKNIQMDVDNIGSKIQYHSEVYLPGWRTLDCAPNIESITQHKIIFDKRFMLLKDVILIHNSSKKY